METRTYTAKLKVGERVRIDRPDYEFTHPDKPDPFKGLTGTILSVIFPGDILYEKWGLVNGTGEVKYSVVLDEPLYGTTGYLFSEKELVAILAQ